MRSSAADPAADLVAVEPGHHDVEEHHVDVVLGEQLQRLLAPDARSGRVQPRGLRTASSSRRFCGWSSTARTVTGRRSIGRLPGQQARHLRGQGAHADAASRGSRRSPSRARSVVVLGHRERRDGDDRHVAARPSARIRRSASDPSMPGSWRSISTRSGRSSAASADPLLPGGGLDDAVPGVPQHVAHQLEVERVVLDHEDRRPVRHARHGPSSTAAGRPRPGPASAGRSAGSRAAPAW